MRNSDPPAPQLPATPYIPTPPTRSLEGEKVLKPDDKFYEGWDDPKSMTNI